MSLAASRHRRRGRPDNPDDHGCAWGDTAQPIRVGRVDRTADRQGLEALTAAAMASAIAAGWTLPYNVYTAAPLRSARLARLAGFMRVLATQPVRSGCACCAGDLTALAWWWSDVVSERGMHSPYCYLDVPAAVSVHQHPYRLQARLLKVRMRANRILRPFGVQVSRSALATALARNWRGTGRTAQVAASLTAAMYWNRYLACEGRRREEADPWLALYLRHAAPVCCRGRFVWLWAISRAGREATAAAIAAGRAAQDAVDVMARHFTDAALARGLDDRIRVDTGRWLTEALAERVSPLWRRPVDGYVPSADADERVVALGGVTADDMAAVVDRAVTIAADYEEDERRGYAMATPAAIARWQTDGLMPILPDGRILVWKGARLQQRGATYTGALGAPYRVGEHFDYRFAMACAGPFGALRRYAMECRCVLAIAAEPAALLWTPVEGVFYTPAGTPVAAYAVRVEGDDILFVRLLEGDDVLPLLTERGCHE